MSSYPDDAKAMIEQMLPEARTIIAIGHHVQTSLEWVWFPFAAEPRGTTCAADLHSKAVAESVLRQLESEGHKGFVLPYPGRCGISFKRLAAATGMGEMGDSFLFVHRQWGPWVHLRLLLTDAEVLDAQPASTTVCRHCGACIDACPGKALSPGRHDLEACGRFIQAMRDTTTVKAGYTPKCEVCARVCPAGQAPAPIEIR